MQRTLEVQRVSIPRGNPLWWRMKIRLKCPNLRRNSSEVNSIDSSEFHQQDWGPPVHSGNRQTPLLAFLSFLSYSPHSLSSTSWDYLPSKNYLHSSPVSTLFLGEHELRHWSNWSTSHPLKGRCFYLLIYVFIPSFQENSSLRVVKESSQIHKTVSDIVVLGGYQLIG